MPTIKNILINRYVFARYIFWRLLYCSSLQHCHPQCHPIKSNASTRLPIIIFGGCFIFSVTILTLIKIHHHEHSMCIVLLLRVVMSNAGILTATHEFERQTYHVIHVMWIVLNRSVNCMQCTLFSVNCLVISYYI